MIRYRYFSERQTLVVIAVLAMGAAQSQDASEFDSGLENDAGLAFSPDGATAYWTAWNGTWGSDPASLRTIFTSKLEDGRWSEAAPLAISGIYEDSYPFVSPDGRWLYFVSDRPADANDMNPDADIWRYELSAPHRLEHLSINSDGPEYSPVITASGTLYFASMRDGGYGQGDLYRAAPSGDGFMPPELLGPAVNSDTGEWNLWVSAYGSEMLFEASSRPTNVSVPGDIYYSWQTDSGWTAAVPVSALNSENSDLLSHLHPNGETLFYTTAPIGGHAEIRSRSWPSLRNQLRANYAPTLIVANRASHEVTFVDLGSGEITDRVETGEGPHLLSNVDNGRVLATGFGEFPRPHAEPVAQRPPFEQEINSRLTLIDVENKSVLLNTRLDDCERPHASWIVGERGYVTCQDERQVLEVDLRDGKALRRFDTRQDGTHVLSFDPDSQVLSASNTGSGSVTLIDIDSGSTRVVELADGSEGANQIDGKFWVANAFEGSISVVDPSTGNVIAHTEPLCSFPIALSPDDQNRVWVVCFASAELIALDRRNFQLVQRFDLDAQPLNLLLHPTRSIAYASLPRENAVAEIDLHSGREIRRIRVGIEPDGLRWAF